MKEVKKLYRSKKDRMIAGVCGGIAEYLGIDSSIVRLLWVLLCLLNGIGIILYIAAAIIIPEAPEEKPSSKSSTEKQLVLILLLVIGIGLIGLTTIGLLLTTIPLLVPLTDIILLSPQPKPIHVIEITIYLLLLTLGVVLILLIIGALKHQNKHPT